MGKWLSQGKWNKVAIVAMKDCKESLKHDQ